MFFSEDSANVEVTKEVDVDPVAELSTAAASGSRFTVEVGIGVGEGTAADPGVNADIEATELKRPDDEAPGTVGGVDPGILAGACEGPASGEDPSPGDEPAADVVASGDEPPFWPLPPPSGLWPGDPFA